MSSQDNLDHRSIDSEAQDPTSMTIEFLRARLLAERAVSKSARAKLDELADKVAELEEQLKIVSLQRKKAEQATADVLAILEDYGYTDISDDYDSKSDEESYSLTNSVSGRSLSWKGRRREQGSSDKIKESRNRRHRGFESVYFSSQRHRQGRSCRQIRRSESRNSSEDYKRDETNVDFQENGVCNGVLPPTSEEASKTVVDVTVAKGNESFKNVIKSNGLEKENSMDINLERALENRAQVIGSFENMEETQKEWEKNFTEKKTSALELCDVGNHSDVTDESNGENSQPQLQGSTVVTPLRNTRSLANDETLSHGSPDNSVTSPDKCCKSCGSRSVDQKQDASPSGGKGKLVSESPIREQDASPSRDKGKRISESPISEFSNSQSFEGISEHSSSTFRSPPVTQPNSIRGSFNSTTAPTIQNQDYSLVPLTVEKSDTSDTVLTALTALQQAKLALLEKVNNQHIGKPEYPSTPGSYKNTYAVPIEPAIGTKSSIPASSFEFPVSCARLFRVPTDFSEASKGNNFLASSSQKAIVTHIPERDIPLNNGFQSQDTSHTTGDQFSTIPYIGGPKQWDNFKVISRQMVDVPGLYKGIPSVSSSAVSGGPSGFEGNQISSTSFNLDRRVSTYAPVPPTRSFYPDPVLLSRETYSTLYYTPPTGDSGDGLHRRVCVLDDCDQTCDAIVRSL